MAAKKGDNKSFVFTLLFVVGLGSKIWITKSWMDKDPGFGILDKHPDLQHS
jgi:hypothetical protein